MDRQIAKDNERADKLGLVLDSDPRRTDARGAEKVEATIAEDTGDETTGNAQAATEAAGRARKEMIQ